MTELDNMLAVLTGERPDRFPYTPMGLWNRHAVRKLLPADCYHDHICCLPEDCWEQSDRGSSSREVSVNYACFMGVSTLGVGKGGACRSAMAARREPAES